MGTFRIRLESVSAISPSFTTGPASDQWWGTSPLGDILTNQDQVANAISITNNFNTNGELIMQFNSLTLGEIRFDTGGTTIILDGNESSPISFAQLPTDFVALTAIIKATYFNSSFDTNTYTINLEKDSGSLSSPFTGVKDTNQIIQFAYTITLGSPSMLDIITNGCGFKLNSNGSQMPAGAQFLIQTLDIEGTYSSQIFTWALNIPTNPVSVNDPVTITSDPLGVNPIDFTQITEISINFGGTKIDIPMINWIVVQQNLFTFLMPSFTSSETVLELTINASTQFSGSVILGKLTTIYFTGVSGLYTLDFNATHDELYDLTNGGTVNVKIPNPLIKTFFAGN